MIKFTSGLSFLMHLSYYSIMVGPYCQLDQLDQARSSDRGLVELAGTGRARSAGVVGVVYLARHRSGFQPKDFGHVQKFE